MLSCPLFKSKPQAGFYETQVKAGLLGLFDGGVVDGLHERQSVGPAI
jgi:hypothetical protein